MNTKLIQLAALAICALPLAADADSLVDGDYSPLELNEFGNKEGKRVNALMSSQAMLLSDEDMANLAVYYEGKPRAVQTVADPDLVSRGEALYRAGIAETGVAACMACHGPKGVGNPAAQYPAIGGQHAAYTEKTLKDYRSGERQSVAGNNAMNEIAAKLTDDDIKALASYLQGLH